MTIDEMIEVLQAAKRGETIQLREKDYVQWRDEEPLWNFCKFEYRVKPKPRVIYRIELIDGRECVYQGYTMDSAERVLCEFVDPSAYRIAEYVEKLP